MLIKKYAIVIIATNTYLPLGLRLVNKINQNIIENSNLTIHLVTSNDCKKYLKWENVIYHNYDIPEWFDNAIFKLTMCEKILKEYNHDYLACLDADTNVLRKFNIEEIFSESFVTKHAGNNSDEKNKMHYELNEKSAAYVHPRDYQDIYYQTCYFGGSREKMSDMLDTAITLKNMDIKNNQFVTWGDEAYLQIYFMKNKPSKIFDQFILSDFPFKMSDKGGTLHQNTIAGLHYKPFSTISQQEYDYILNCILLNKESNDSWDIKDNQFYFM